MSWGFFGVVAAVSVALALYLRSKGLAGVGYTVPVSTLIMSSDTVHMTGHPAIIYLSLPSETQGAAANLGNGFTAAPAPYWISVTRDGVPVDLSAQPGYPSPLAIPLVQASGKIVATYQVSAALGIIPLQGVLSPLTFTLNYEP